jgi:serine/threonine protein phosphatase 1
MGRNFVIGDIHGAHRALTQCLDRTQFDYEKDHLISLGDVTDGWPETRQCVDELLKIKNLTYILGNHDFWTLEWMETGTVEPVWYEQGGKATLQSYGNSVPSHHVKFFKRALPYFIDDGKLFVHAGIVPHMPIKKQPLQTLLWDRELARTALNLYQKVDGGQLTGFKNVYLGHTPIPYTKPIQSAGIWLMDTGAGWSGVLSMMNVDTEEVFTSDPVPELYPGVEGRKRKASVRG